MYQYLFMRCLNTCQFESTLTDTLNFPDSLSDEIDMAKFDKMSFHAIDISRQSTMEDDE